MKNKLMLLTVISATGLILGLTNNVREVGTFAPVEAKTGRNLSIFVLLY